MTTNSNLKQAKDARFDEFFTTYEEVEREMNGYISFNKDVFKDKVILLPCDDHKTSSFTKYFAEHFDEYGIRMLVSSCLAKTTKHGKLQIISRSPDNRRVVENKYLSGNGDFRSIDVSRLRDKADMIITNPPWSLFREFFSWIMDGRKQFITICNINCIGNPNVFSYIKKGVVFPGNRWHRNIGGHGILFEVDNVIQVHSKNPVKEDGRVWVPVASAGWLTNVPHAFNHKLDLHTMEYNLKYGRPIVVEKGYRKYDNYDAIEVPFCDAIPSDYEGLMGVPITFLEYYDPAEFEIIGKTGHDDPYDLKTKKYTVKDGPILKSLLSVAVLEEDDGYRAVYQRLLIKHRR